VTHVHQVGERGKYGGVNQGDTEAVDHERDDNETKVGTERKQETAEPFEGQTDGGDEPLLLREHLDELHGEVHPEHVGDEGREPDGSDLELIHVHGRAHPAGDGRLQESERHIGHHQRAGADRDVGV